MVGAPPVPEDMCIGGDEGEEGRTKRMSERREERFQLVIYHGTIGFGMDS